MWEHDDLGHLTSIVLYFSLGAGETGVDVQWNGSDSSRD